MNNDYIGNAKLFLQDTNAELSISKAYPQKRAPWIKTDEEQGIHYWCVLRRGKKQYGFDFWDSIDNKKANKRPNEYDILSCLNTLSENNFPDFCDAFGYDTDSIKALKTFEACQEQDKGLRRIFTDIELEKLNNIC